jgi:hypothetical protein
VRQEDPTLDITAAPSKQKSSVAESKAPTDDARRMIEGGLGYPMDGIKESTSCELHQRMKNISMKVAVGQALPSSPDVRWHGREILAGYAKVGVDERSSTSLDPKMRGNSEKYWVESSYRTRTTSSFQDRPQGQHRLRVVACHLHLHHLQAPHMVTATTTRVHLDHHRRTWVGHLRRRSLRILSGSVPARTLHR